MAQTDWSILVGSKSPNKTTRNSSINKMQTLADISSCENSQPMTATCSTRVKNFSNQLFKSFRSPRNGNNADDGNNDDSNADKQNSAEWRHQASILQNVYMLVFPKILLAWASSCEYETFVLVFTRKSVKIFYTSKRLVNTSQLYKWAFKPIFPPSRKKILENSTERCQITLCIDRKISSVAPLWGTCYKEAPPRRWKDKNISASQDSNPRLLVNKACPLLQNNNNCQRKASQQQRNWNAD